ncbi:MAG: hypothetical protein IIZ55_02700 [Firmicutes bacterium]|nr:hypothetical protein [Bacillota bacterium]
MSKEIERAGIPLVQITAIPNIAEMLGVYRVLVGKAVPHPCGDPKLSPEDEHKLMRKYMEKALEMLQTEIVDDKPITVTLE